MTTFGPVCANSGCAASNKVLCGSADASPLGAECRLCVRRTAGRLCALCSACATRDRRCHVCGAAVALSWSAWLFGT